MNRIAFLLLAWLGTAGLVAGAERSSYAIVVSRATQAQADWRAVVEALQSKHAGQVLAFETNVAETLPRLREVFPRHACFVARPEEATRAFVAQVHRLTRELDADPYADCFWGILTGYDAKNALGIARHAAPLTVRKVGSGTEVELKACEEGVWSCELRKNKGVRKEKGGEPQPVATPDDTTEFLAKLLTEYQADCFVTSGHATERDWQIGFRYRNGTFRCADGVLYGLDTQGRKLPIHSPNPKVYLPIGNCLMGHIDGRDAMALAWMNSAGVKQMLGYTQPTWYGYAGWGCLDYFIEQPGRYTFTEAFFANQAALIHRLETFFPEQARAELDARGNLRVAGALSEAARTAGLTAQDARGLVFDRDVLAFYGDPAWSARMADGPRAWEQSLTEEGGVWTFEVKPRLGERTFEPVNKNGSQRGGRPLVAFLPRRIGPAKVVEGAELKPVITDDFVLVPNPGRCEAGRVYRVKLQAGAAR